MLPFYVPIDEDFSELKEVTFGARALYSVLHGVVPILDSVVTDKDKGFPLFTSIDLLYNQGVNVPAPDNGILSALPRLVKGATDATNTVIKFETPETIDSKTVFFCSCVFTYFEFLFINGFDCRGHVFMVSR